MQTSKRNYIKGPPRVRLLGHLLIGDGCWEWDKPNNHHGYGEINIEGKIFRANRVAWEQANGPISDGLWVLHHCDNPACCRISHLFLGTPKDNMMDCSAKGRTNGPAKSKPGEKHPMVKLTWNIVDQIRSSQETSSSWAKRLGMHHSTICYIRKGKLWREETRNA